jgi:cellulose synthase/poly-beta-1,6-N-acetylglucosamine synthase-like glycosyltransferase
MLSICIPVYNYNVCRLVEDLHKQIIKIKIPAEIIIVDDLSDEQMRITNRKISLLPNVKYIELENKLGRARIRNYFSALTSYEYLLFIDCDAMVDDDKFLGKYISEFEPNTVITGGLAYEEAKPEQSFMLRWTYGRKREVIAFSTRKISPYKSFKTFNFLIPKNIFLKIMFKENIDNYGHEDTLFGYELKKNKIKILHIDNALIHKGLESNEVFIRKTEKGLENLYRLYIEYKDNDDLINDIKILKFYKVIKNLKIKFFVMILYKLLHKILLRNLTGKHPYMKIFDFYKLGYMCSIT